MSGKPAVLNIILKSRVKLRTSTKVPTELAKNQIVFMPILSGPEFDSLLQITMMAKQTNQITSYVERPYTAGGFRARKTKPIFRLCCEAHLFIDPNFLADEVHR